jgi:site-specific DNA-methyltransferase (adenine-specific)
MINLMQGDCLERMKEIPDGSVDMVLTDPPFGTTQCKWDSVIPFEPMWEQLKRIIKPNGAIVLFGSEPFSSVLRVSNLRWYKYDWIFRKVQATGHLNAKKQPMRDHEDIMIFYQKQCVYNPQKHFVGVKSKTPIVGKRRSGKSDSVYRSYSEKKPDYVDDGTRYPSQMLEGYYIPERHNSSQVGNSHHPTQKPVSLMEYLIKTYTNEGETVLDFTMGSGTTGVACVNLDRNFIGIEMDEGYFEIAKKRIGV